MITDFMLNASSLLAPSLILVIYFISMAIIAVYSHNKSKSLSSFFMADRGLGGWMTAFAYGTTYFSAVVFVGYAGRFGMTMGLAAVWIGVANAVLGSLCPWLVLGRRTRSMTRRLKTTTMPEFFEKRYQNKNIKLVSSFIIFVFLIPYSTSVYQGLGQIFEMIFGLDFKWCVLIMALVTALYVFSGGYFATALSDFIQGIIMIGVVIAMIILMFKTPQVNGIEGLRTLTEKGYGLLPSFNAASGNFMDSPGFNLIILICLTSFGIWAMPQSVHKFYAVKDNRAIKQATIISTVFALIIGVSAYLNGGFSRLFFPGGYPAGGADAVVPTMLTSSNFSNVMLGFIMVLVLAASMSTLSALALSSSSAVAIDAYKGYINKNASDNKVRILMRILCLVFVGLSAVLAIFKVDAIVTLMSLSWGCLAGCFIGPFIYGLYWKKTTSAAAMTSVISGVALTFILIFIFGITTKGADTFGEILKAGIQRAPFIGVLTMCFSLIITPLVSLFTKKPGQEHIDFCFKKDE